MAIHDKLLKIPKNPGVYFFKNKDNEIIYIGKAKILKNRIKSYFVKSSKQTCFGFTTHKYFVLMLTTMGMGNFCNFQKLNTHYCLPGN